eukprot:GEMP01062774.1.p1 GENE.GEMP01062774.1~~GEMP01062774.1.p1  ORF type:complete len:150 (-),score=5.51 GEMP01062774.1:120-569(-)
MLFSSEGSPHPQEALKNKSFVNVDTNITMTVYELPQFSVLLRNYSFFEFGVANKKYALSNIFRSFGDDVEHNGADDGRRRQNCDRNPDGHQKRAHFCHVYYQAEHDQPPYSHQHHLWCTDLGGETIYGAMLQLLSPTWAIHVKSLHGHN